MKELNIYVYGEIENFQSADSGNYGIVSLKSIVDQVNAEPDAEKLIVHIHSMGGSVVEGFAIHDYLRSTGKEIKTIIEGMCASIATVVALAGKERVMTKNSEFMIHNPWSFGLGTADELHEQADSVKDAEEKILNFYVEKTGGDKEKIKQLMDEQTFMSAEKAVELGFITSVLEDSKNLVYATIRNKKPQMKKETKQSLIDGIRNLAKEFGIIKDNASDIEALDLKLKDSEETIHVDTESETAKVGDKVSKAGADVPSQEYNLDNGQVLKTDENSLVLSIEDAKNENAAAKLEVEQIKAENESLKTKVAELEKSISDAEAENEIFATEITNQIKELKASIKSDYKPENRQGNEGRYNPVANDSGVSAATDKVKAKIEERRKKRAGIK